MLNHEEFYELIQLDKDFRQLKQLEAYDNFWNFCLYMDYEFFNNREEISNGVNSLLANLITSPEPIFRLTSDTK